MLGWLAGNWGNIASALGLVVSIIGFSVAVAQIVRSKRAAEAAREAILETRESLTKNITLVDLTRASDRIQEIRRFHWESQWPRALDLYRPMRLMLSDIISQHSSLVDEDRQILLAGIERLQLVEEAVGRATGSGGDFGELQPADEFLIEIQLLIDRLTSELKQSLQSTRLKYE